MIPADMELAKAHHLANQVGVEAEVIDEKTKSKLVTSYCKCCGLQV